MEGHLVADHLNFCVLARQPVGQHTGGSAEFSSEKSFWLPCIPRLGHIASTK